MPTHNSETMSAAREYLAAALLSEDRPVTYRLLSRALKINVNIAKEVLYQFHRQQNLRRPGSVHATYVVAGYERLGPSINVSGGTKPDGEDVQMQSSPPHGGGLQPIDETGDGQSVLNITLVHEGDLAGVRSQFESISSIHVYSLAPTRIKDLQLLSDVTRSMQDICFGEDPLEMGKVYGSTTNAFVRRRTAGSKPASSSNVHTAPPKVFEPKQKKTAVASNAESDAVKTSSKKSVRASSSLPQAAKEEKEPLRPEKKAPNPPKRESSNLFKAFAKAKPKIEREGSASSVGTSGLESGAQSPGEDTPMKDVSEDEEDDYIPPVQQSSKMSTGAHKPSRRDRDEALRKMMEEEEQGEEERAKGTGKGEGSGEANADQDKDDGGSGSGISENAVAPSKRARDADSTGPSQSTDAASQSASGRRQGRRQVMKKKTIRDEEGYLVTKEEAAWESFSEDEPAVITPKPSFSASSAKAKPKQNSGKASQGSIMSFFGKK